MWELVEIIFVWVLFTMEFNYFIFNFLYFKGVKIIESGVWSSAPGINALPINCCNVTMNSLSDSMWLDGNKFSLHSLQNQVVLFWTKRKSSCNKEVQFLCTFLWQHWHRTLYEFRNIFLLHIGQMLIRSFITDRKVDFLENNNLAVKISYSGGNF